MQAQPTRRISPEVQTNHQTSVTNSYVNGYNEDSSSRSSTSSWTEEPVATVNMDIMTGHLILVCSLL